MSENFKQWYGMSDPAILELLGNYIHKTRLSKNKTQSEIASAAGINRSTLVQIEKGKGANLLSFIQVLRSLEQLHTLDAFEFKQEISPLKLAEMELKLRKRARKNNHKSNEPTSTW